MSQWFIYVSCFKMTKSKIAVGGYTKVPISNLSQAILSKGNL